MFKLFRDVADFVLKHATFFHPTPTFSLLKISPYSPVYGLWATKCEVVGLIVRAINFQDFQPVWPWSTNVTDRQTDGRTDDMQSQYRALR